MESPRPPLRRARVPTTRLERAGRVGALLAQVAGRAVWDAARGASSSAADLANPANARNLAGALGDLRGAALKLGQILSMQGEELLPEPLGEILAALRNHATCMPQGQVHGVLRRELGKDWRERLVEFDDEPLAAASIGQVHAATASDGRDLAIKLQYPRIERSIDGDVDGLVLILRTLRALPASLDLDALVPELKRELHREADYRREAGNAERYAELLGPSEEFFAPRVHRDLSTRRVLALDRVRGLPVEDLRSPEHPPELRDRLGGALLRLVFREIFEFRFVQTDPNFANFLYEPERQRIALLDFGSVRRLAKPFVRTYAHLARAASEGSREKLLKRSRELGLLAEDAGPEAEERFAGLCELIAEPLSQPGPYAFADSDLPLRARDLSLDVYSTSSLPSFPPELLFIHRKLAGTYLLLQHVGARADARAIFESVAN